MSPVTQNAKRTPPEDESEGVHAAQNSYPKGTADLTFAAALDSVNDVPVFVLRPNAESGRIKGRYAAPKGWERFTHDGNAARLAKVRPGDALAMLCGGVFDVIDYDPRNDPDGSSLARLRAEGLVPRPIYVVQTPGGGWHIYVRASGVVTGLPLLGVDYLAHGHLVLIPGSEGYRLLSEGEWPELGGFPEDAAARLAALAARRPTLASRSNPADLSVPATDAELALVRGALRKSEQAVRSAPEGERNVTLFFEAVWLANYAAGECLDWDEVTATLTEAALEAGLTAGDTTHTLWSAWERGEKDPRRPRVDSGFEALPVDEQLELLDAIFDATPLLRHVRQAAHARITSPTSLLGALLVKVMSRVPVNHVIPPIIGSRASLNFAVALVARSGAGKSTSMDLADELLEDDLIPRVYEAGPGSGEGLVQAFLQPYKDPITKVTQWVIKDYPHVLLTVDEIGRLGKVQERNGSSMASVLRTSLTGGSLTTSNADRDRNRVVPKKSYRFTAIAGVQPSLSGILLNDEDAGTPQRWVWLPAKDSCTPEMGEKPEWPGPLSWSPVMDDREHVLSVPDGVVWELQARQTKIVQGKTEAGLDSHSGLTRLKVAAALAYLHGERDITPSWWALSGSVMRVSDAVRADCLAALRDQSDQEVKWAGRRDALRGEAAAAHRAAQLGLHVQLVARRVAEHAATDEPTNNRRHERDQGCTKRCLSHALRHHAGADVMAAIERAVDQGRVEQKEGRWFPGEPENTTEDKED